MANGRSGPKARKSAVTVQGAWFAMPLEVLRSRAVASLSPHATKMLVDLCSQLGRNSSNNGKLSAAPRVMELRGWTSSGSRQAAIDELVGAGFVSITRPGNRKLCTLYALTLWPLDYEPGLMVHGPGSYDTSDWRRGPNAADDLSPARLSELVPPAPAKWNALRKGEPRATEENAIGYPAAGKPPLDKAPPRANPGRVESAFDPAAGSKGPKSRIEVSPPRDTYLDMPSARTSKAAAT